MGRGRFMEPCATDAPDEPPNARNFGRRSPNGSKVARRGSIRFAAMRGGTKCAALFIENARNFDSSHSALDATRSPHRHETTASQFFGQIIDSGHCRQASDDVRGGPHSNMRPSKLRRERFIAKKFIGSSRSSRSSRTVALSNRRFSQTSFVSNRRSPRTVVRLEPSFASNRRWFWPSSSVLAFPPFVSDHVSFASHQNPPCASRPQANAPSREKLSSAVLSTRLGASSLQHPRSVRCVALRVSGADRARARSCRCSPGFRRPSPR